MRVSPFTIVEKLDSLKGDRSLVEELLWFLESFSDTEEAITQMARSAVQMNPHAIGPENIRSSPLRQKLSSKQSAAFWETIPFEFHPFFKGLIPDGWLNELSSLLRDDDGGAAWKRAMDKQKGFPELSVEDVREVLRRIAEKEVTDCLQSLCKNRDSDLLPYIELRRHPLECWSFPALADALKEHLRRHAENAKSRIAETSVVKKTFHALDFVWEDRVMVQIEGDPRHGKTEAIRTYCEMYPGRARLISTPSETNDAEFFIAVAEALHIPLDGPTCNVGNLRRKIDHVLRSAKLLLIFDEFHFAIPQAFSKTTPPKRMNWIRTRVADRGLPTALIITPQSYNPAMQRYVEKTGYRFEQFVGRVARFKLPKGLEESDVIAVVRLHFPDIAMPFVELIASDAMIHAGYLQLAEITAKYARFLARQDGRKMTKEHVLQAIAERMPCKADARAEKPSCNRTKQSVPEPKDNAETGEQIISRLDRQDSNLTAGAEVLAA
jgi:hypothetical protein